MNNIVKKEEAGALVANMFEADANQGSQNITQDDLALPFLKVLGQLSPEVNERDGKHVEGAKPGMILNTVTKEIYDGTEGINVLPAHYERKLVEWQDRGDSKGAPVAIHNAESDIMSQTTRDKSYKDRLPNGNYLDRTASHFVIVGGNAPSTALITMKSTQLKISRKWNSMMAGIRLKGKNGLFTPASFSHIYRLKTTQMSNDKGTWFGWEVSKVGPVEDAALYKQAKEFAENISKGDVEVSHSETAKETKPGIKL